MNGWISRPTFRSLLFAAAAALAQLDGLVLAADQPPSPAKALQAERENFLPITHFYDAPHDLSKSKPGDLLRRESFMGYMLPAGVRAMRILYHSLDAGGTDVVTSAAVLIPAGAQPSSGWPIIAWAHGTSGVARMCAPSLMKDVYYGDEGLYAMVKAGF